MQWLRGGPRSCLGVMQGDYAIVHKPGQRVDDARRVRARSCGTGFPTITPTRRSPSCNRPETHVYPSPNAARTRTQAAANRCPKPMRTPPRLPSPSPTPSPPTPSTPPPPPKPPNPPNSPRPRLPPSNAPRQEVPPSRRAQRGAALLHTAARHRSGALLLLLLLLLAAC